MIRRLYVHNFRCLVNFELKLEGAGSVLFLGKNGAGKSTVGLALELLQGIGRGSNRVGDLVKPRDLTNGQAGVPMRFEIEIDLHGSIHQYLIAFEYPPKFRELRVLEEALIVDGRPVFRRKLAEVQIARGGAAPESTFRIDWHLVALPIVQDQATQDALANFKAWLGNILVLRPVPSLFRGQTDGDDSAPAVIDTRAVAIGAWFTDMVATSPAAYSLVSAYLSEVIPGFEQIKNENTGRNTRDLGFHFGANDDRFSLQLDQLSDGEKIFVLYSLVIAASKTQGQLLCFWDEPDNFLSPDEVGHSIMALRRAFRGGGQLLVTSHNPEAIRRFSDEDTFYFERKTRLEPTIHRTVGEIRDSGDYTGSFVDAMLRGDIGAGAGT